MEQKRSWLERPIHPSLPAITNEVAAFALILLTAVATRFYNLGARVMSHDESLITYFSYLLYKGQGYQHTPMMHGPLEFYLTALSYFVFGPSDFTSRIPPALFSIFTVWMAWYWRRYLGKAGALIAGFVMVVSPYMLYYGRYARNEVYGSFSGVVMLYAILRYLETGTKRYIYLVTAALTLHFVDKSTAFIYSAQALLFLAIYFIVRITRQPWKEIGAYRAFLAAFGAAVLLIAATLGSGAINGGTGILSGSETAPPANPVGTVSPFAPSASPLSPTTILILGSLAALLTAGYFLVRGYGWKRIRAERSFDLLILIGTLVLPSLTPFLLRLLNWTIPTTAPEVAALTTIDVLRLGAFLIPAFLISIAIGQWWDSKIWWKNALLFWTVYILFYTTFFTNASGLFTGVIGMLGYWLAQQGVQRGSQPWYYYTLIQIPIYEFLPALGFLLALALGLKRKLTMTGRVEEEETEEPINLPAGRETEEAINLPAAKEAEETINLPAGRETEERNFPNTFSLLTWWSITSLIAFSYAGERMPWLTYHIAWSMILITGWALGRLIETTDWKKLMEQRVLLALTASAVFITSIAGTALALNGTPPPFQGKELAQLQATNAFLLPLFVSILSAVGMVYFLRKWTFREIRNVFILVFFGFLAILTIRTSFRASYITYDQATEFLVYAHGATGIKDVIEQAREISQRTTGGMGVAIAYDASAPDTGVSWPFVWYLRDFTNQRSFDQPTRSLRDSVIIIVDEKNFDKIEPAIGPGYYRVDYIRMWWPMQDYFNLVSDRDPNTPFAEDYACNGIMSFLKLRKSKDYSRFCEGFTNPAVRAGIVQIWLNRDYTLYAQAKGRTDLTLTTWQPADRMRLYIRKDVASQIWNFGIAPTAVETIKDPTEGKYIQLSADLTFDSTQANPVLMNAPRSLAFAKDGTVYVADSRNNRVLHLGMDGKILHEWGTYADGANIPVGPGTFNEPWGIAVGPDGSVYVTDTWNHRIQKFTAEGKFITAWGTFGQGETPQAFYGPRGLAVDAEGRVYVADTGNKRIVVFDANGKFITQFGSAGFEPGQFDEPVGVTVDKNGTVYVVDTWNQRVQTFTRLETEDLLTFTPDRQWDVYGWFGQSLDNKPFIAVNDDLNVFITDPEGFRVMEFEPNGTLVRTWGDFGNTGTSFGLASGIAVDAKGRVWVTDGLYNRILRFTLP